jgi:hypothetical protein
MVMKNDEYRCFAAMMFIEVSLVLCSSSSCVEREENTGSTKRDGQKFVVVGFWSFLPKSSAVVPKMIVGSLESAP